MSGSRTPRVPTSPPGSPTGWPVSRRRPLPVPVDRTRSALLETRLVAQLVDLLRRLGLGQVLGHVVPRPPRERPKVRGLRARHRLAARDPVLRVLLETGQV